MTRLKKFFSEILGNVSPRPSVICLKTKKDIRPKALQNLSQSADISSDSDDDVFENLDEEMPKQKVDPITTLILPKTGIPCPQCPQYFNDLRLVGFQK